MKQFSEGAEAKLFECEFAGAKALKKIRNPKKYRNPVLDLRLRRTRTKREESALRAAFAEGILCPKLFSADLEKCELVIEFLEGKLLRVALPSLSGGQEKKVLGECGLLLGKLHSRGLAHGDFTSSNLMLLKGGRIAVIDFGLSQFSHSFEELATDLFLFKKSVSDAQFEEFLGGYRGAFAKAGFAEKRLGEMLLRGRYVERKIASKNGGNEPI